MKENQLENVDKKVKTANNLLDQIIEAAEFDDAILKEYWISKAQGEKAVGDSFVLFHLKILKKLLNE
jgi:hypothetical protein